MQVYFHLASSHQGQQRHCLQSACDALLTTGKTCERKTLRQFVKRGEIIVADRYYGLEYGFFHELNDLGASYVIRIRNQPLMEVVQELPLSEADRAAGVTWLDTRRNDDGAPVQVESDES